MLSKLYGQVYLSTVVYQEVVVQGRLLGYSDSYLLQMAVHKDQLVVLETTEADLPSEISSLPLDTGEKTTIYLALSNPDSLVLLDDLNAREEAKTRGLKVKGTLSVTERCPYAKTDERASVQELRRSGDIAIRTATSSRPR